MSSIDMNEQPEAEEVLSHPLEGEMDVDEALDNIEANDAADPTPLVQGSFAAGTDWSVTGGNAITSDTTDVSSGNIYNPINELRPGATYRAEFVAVPTPNQGVVLDSMEVREIPQEQPVAVEAEVIPEPKPVHIPEDPPRPEDMPFGPMTKRQANDGWDQKEAKERIERRKKRDDLVRRQMLQQKRKRIHQHQHYFMTPDDLMIMMPQGHSSPHFIKTDTQRSGKVMDLSKNTDSNRHTGDYARVLTNGIIYDKNMNPLTINYSKYPREKSDKRFSRIDKYNSVFGKFNDMSHKYKWIVVNKEALMLSRGKDFRIRNKTGYTIQEALEIKKKVVEYFERGEKFITYLRDMIGQVYDQDNFDIIYQYSLSSAEVVNMFYIYIQFPDLTLSNSIEVTHQIENLVTRMTGKHCINDNTENKMRIVDGLQGLRTTFSPVDLFFGFQHSHLPSFNNTWDGFCMGEDHFMTCLEGTYRTNELEFETLLVAMYDHVSWESLEGGPYQKMESIGSFEGSNVSLSNDRNIRTYNSDLIVQVFEIVQLINFTKLQDAFTLKIQNGKEASYEFNKTLFIKLFIKELDQDRLFDFNEEHELESYAYVPSDDTFIRSNFEGRLPKNWDALYKDARQKISLFPILYINGKYIKPTLTDEKIPISPVKRSLPTVHPDIIMYVAKIIHFHLLNELKNVKV